MGAARIYVILEVGNVGRNVDWGVPRSYFNRKSNGFEAAVRVDVFGTDGCLEQISCSHCEILCYCYSVMVGRISVYVYIAAVDCNEEVYVKAYSEISAGGEEELSVGI